jgi:uncharacterized protein
MNILVLGATGRVGSKIVAYALRDNHKVTALVRTPEKIKIVNENLTIIQGNVLSKDDLLHSIKGVELVISALNTDGTTTLSKSMPLIIEAMNYERVTRIITVGTAGILESRTALNLLRYETNESKRKTNRAAKEHHKVYELLNKSALNWTIVCPTYLSNRESLEEYRAERNFLPLNGVEISVSDTAEFTYKQIRNRDFIKSRVGISY